MKSLVHVVLYASLAFGANAAMGTDRAELEALREGTMKKLIFSDPIAASDVGFVLEDGGEASLADFTGKHIVLNFWATWCAPCRKEMPGLAKLQDRFGGDGFEVVTIATGRNPEAAMRRFFEEIGVDNLPLHRDPNQALARSMAVLGLPVTVILDPEGNEIARVRGDAHWDSDSAFSIIGVLTGAEPADDS